MKHYKSIIFDMDGTLLDSMEMWAQLDRKFLLENGIEPPPDISDIVKKMTIDTSSAYFVERFAWSQARRMSRQSSVLMNITDCIMCCMG